MRESGRNYKSAPSSGAAPEVMARTESASVKQLERWALYVLAAKTVHDVFTV